MKQALFEHGDPAALKREIIRIEHENEILAAANLKLTKLLAAALQEAAMMIAKLRKIK